MGKNEALSIDAITKLKAEVEKHKNRIGKKKLAEIMYDHFALPDDKAEKLMKLINEMIPSVSYDAIPKKWFFESKKPRRVKSSQYRTVRAKKGRHTKTFRKPLYRPEILKEQAVEMRQEKMKIKKTVEKFWSLSDTVKPMVLKLWPEKYWPQLQRQEIDCGDEMCVPSSDDIANLIISKRYLTTESTVATYTKPSKSE